MVSIEVMKKLAIPPVVSEAIADMRGGWLNMPPGTLLDTLLLANQYAPVASPLDSRRAKSSSAFPVRAVASPQHDAAMLRA